MSIFKIKSDFTPKGDQPSAIKTLTMGLEEKKKHQVLLGVTGSGKTFTMAHVIAGLNRPALVMAPNKTLAAQLYNEFRGLFPENAVEYFVSYYDYYQPEAYIPSSDTYIQKDSSLNEMIDKMRHSATRSVLSRRDVIVVASVSCIFGLGAPEDYLGMRIDLENDQELSRERLLSDLVRMHYDRNDIDFHRGVFRVRGDCVDIFPAYEENTAIRLEFFGDQIDMITEIDPLRGTAKRRLNRITLFPASHYVTRQQTRQRATKTIIAELKERLDFFRDNNQLVEAQRIEERTNFDLEMMQEIGYCTGIENYSRHLTDRAPGEPPPTLMDYFPDDYLLFIDESHISVPQIRAMYKGDRSRKQTLVQYGFRLPSALDNRPLKFDEFESRINQVIYISATPSDYEIDQGKNSIVEQIVRPTGLLDPAIDIRPAKNQVDDLLEQIRKRIDRNERVLVTTLTKRMAEDLTEYYEDLGLKVRYLHSDISTFERMDIIQDLRTGLFDVLVGINLLREGLDLPEVTLVAILDADKEGFLRSARSLIQTFGRASRNVNGKVIMYADRITPSMKNAVEETGRRRKIQQKHNKVHHIKPESIRKDIVPVFMTGYNQTGENAEMIAESLSDFSSTDDIDSKIKKLEKKMDLAARDLEFESAARFRDRIEALKKLMVFEL
ncbi:MAG: excinuclease ABC subunit B [Desulfobacteraceae bacterium 4572_123]|nr:MAG: excinuclease ABC subunit B [Desulfobacteraceae bacterium 4572_123]